MNITIGQRTRGIPLRARYIASMAGAALVASALVIGSSWHDKGAGGAADPSIPARSSIYVPSSDEAPKQFVVFIAASEQQAKDHFAQLYQDLNPSWFGAYSFVVVTNAEEEARARATNAAIAMELTDSGVDFHVVDLRSAPLAPIGPVGASASTRPGRLTTSSPSQVTFYLVADKAAAEQAQAYEELAQWIRHDNLVSEPNRSVVMLIAGSNEEQTRAQYLIDDAMAAGNFSDGNLAPAFEVIDLR